MLVMNTRIHTSTPSKTISTPGTVTSHSTTQFSTKRQRNNTCKTMAISVPLSSTHHHTSSPKPTRDLLVNPPSISKTPACYLVSAPPSAHIHSSRTPASSLEFPVEDPSSLEVCVMRHSWMVVVSAGDYSVSLVAGVVSAVVVAAVAAAGGVLVDFELGIGSCFGIGFGGEVEVGIVIGSCFEIGFGGEVEVGSGGGFCVVLGVVLEVWMGLEVWMLGRVRSGVLASF
ncbi:hypothetical protein K440DRAFT_332964 [Wilcoxina mikolae CBS 423.85]|nr:hypothetical protein K440DRAFT_332964 [Wilcoxina mikolae CBS 423.85]